MEEIDRNKTGLISMEFLKGKAHIGEYNVNSKLKKKTLQTKR